ncbi:MAG: diguanylate cyclase [Acidobacteria bacterium]|nr:diguanylate cyclase [Acidobacteriota bacterium]
MRWKTMVPAGVLAIALGAPAVISSSADEKVAPPTTSEALLARAKDTDLAPAERAGAARQALELGKRRRDRSLQADALFALAQAEWAAEELGDALQHCRLALALFRETGDEKGVARALRRTGDIQYRLGSYRRAMESYLRALGKAEALARREPNRDNRLAVGHLHVTLGNVLRRIGDKTQALDEYRTAAAAYEAEEYRLGEAGIELNLGNLLFDMGRNREALAPYGKARDLARALGKDELLSMALTNLASTQVRLGDTAPARRALEESIDICNRIGRGRGNLHNFLTMGDLLNAEGDQKGALTQYAAALKLALQLEDLPHAAEIHGRMANVLHRLGKDGAAVDHLFSERKIRSRILDTEETARISEMRAVRQADRREADLALIQQQEASARRLNIYLRLGLGLAVLLLALAAGGLLARARAVTLVTRQKAQLQSAYDRMEELSRTDDLTGLPNRRDALLRLDLEARRSERSGAEFGVGIADVDELKAVNDQLGHQAGDRLLILVSRALEKSVRGLDYVARIGGDEFLLLFPDVDSSGLQIAMERVLQTVRGLQIVHRSGTLHPTLSVGLVVCRGGDPEALLQRADVALYQAKSRGKNTYEILEEG